MLKTRRRKTKLNVKNKKIQEVLVYWLYFILYFILFCWLMMVCWLFIIFFVLFRVYNRFIIYFLTFRNKHAIFSCFEKTISRQNSMPQHDVGLPRIKMYILSNNQNNEATASIVKMPWMFNAPAQALLFGTWHRLLIFFRSAKVGQILFLSELLWTPQISSNFYPILISQAVYFNISTGSFWPNYPFNASENTLSEIFEVML